MKRIFLVLLVLFTVTGIEVALGRPVAPLAAISNNTAIVLFMDTWEDPPLAYWEENHPDCVQEWTTRWETLVEPFTINVLVPLAQQLYSKNIPIVFSSNVFNLSSLFQQDIPNITSTQVLDNYLKQCGIDTIYYVGYTTNICILTRPTGTRKMSELGYKVILVQDATLSTPGYVYAEADAIDEIKSYGSTILLKQMWRELNVN